MPDSDQPEEEKLPGFKTWDECLAHCNEIKAPALASLASGKPRNCRDGG
jgi:hypothetical protein